MIISSLPNFLYHKLIGAKVVAVISFLQEYAVICHFYLRHIYQEDFPKRDEKCFLLVLLGAFGANA